MHKKKASTAKPPTVITITLPDEGHLPRTGQILVQRGTLAIIRQFAYSSLSEISVAIQQAAASLIQLEQNPPEVKPAAETTPTPEPPAAIQDTDDTADAEAENIDEHDEAPADNPPSLDDPSGPMSLM